jgi:hypothetical protein
VKVIPLDRIIRKKYLDKVQALREFVEKERGKGEFEAYIKGKFGDSTFQDSPLKKTEFVLALANSNLPIEHWMLVRERLRDLAYLTGQRHSEEYALDLVVGWICEELVADQLRTSEGVASVQLVGIDRARDFARVGIRVTADLEVEFADGRKASVDLYISFGGTWTANGQIDLKKGKFDAINKGTLDFVLAMDLDTKNLYVIGKNELHGIKGVSNASMDGKTTYGVRTKGLTGLKLDEAVQEMSEYKVKKNE